MHAPTPRMPLYNCISCDATFPTRKKLSAHKPQCKLRPSLTDDIFQQIPAEKRARLASPSPERFSIAEFEPDLPEGDVTNAEV